MMHAVWFLIAVIDFPEAFMFQTSLKFTSDSRPLFAFLDSESKDGGIILCARARMGSIRWNHPSLFTNGPGLRSLDVFMVYIGAYILQCSARWRCQFLLCSKTNNITLRIINTCIHAKR